MQKYAGYYERALRSRDRRFIKIFERMGYDPGPKSVNTAQNEAEFPVAPAENETDIPAHSVKTEKTSKSKKPIEKHDTADLLNSDSDSVIAEITSEERTQYE